MKLKRQVVKFLKELDIDDVGFADVASYRRIENASIPQEILPNCKTAIVYLTELKKLEEKYGKWYIVSLVNHLSKTNKKLIGLLEEEGFAGRGVGENEYCRETLVGKISFRQLAALANLGSIGENQMLIHRTLGPRCVIGVILTDAKIKPSTSQKKLKLCTGCGICKKLCPVEALNKAYDRWKCKNRRKILGKGCGIPCVNLCPVGKIK